MKSALTKLNEIQSNLKNFKNENPYFSNQIKIALERLATVEPALKKIGSRTAHESITSIRQARIQTEIAAEAVDAEPPARVLSIPIYDKKLDAFVIFGGDHFDYLLNDVWVFYVKDHRWEQRHATNNAPEPRANHLLIGDNDGKITVRGGFIYHRRNPLPKDWNRHADSYVHAGAGDWIYDLEKNSWSGPSDAESAPSGTRGYREKINSPWYSPDDFTEGERPNAEAHEKFLKEIPVNTWVDLNPKPRFMPNRDWGTLGYDEKRDMIYYYNGGHSAYGGTDVAHYSLATNRWDQLVEADIPLNLKGASGRSLPGWSFSKNPWMTNHTWNSYKFHPELDRLIVAGRFSSPVFPKGMGQPDQNLYLYNPETTIWDRKPSNVLLSCMGAQLLYIPKVGMLEWARFILNSKTLEWEKLEVKGEAPKSMIDHCGFVYDEARSRVLLFNGGNYGDKNPYKGEAWAMKIPSNEIESLKIEGSEHIPALTKEATPMGNVILREIVYHPELKLFIVNSFLAGDAILAYDPEGNRWVGLEIPAIPKKGGQRTFGLSTAWVYDKKRNLIYSVGHYSDVFVLKLDPKTLKIKPLAEIVASLPANPATEKPKE